MGPAKVIGVCAAVAMIALSHGQAADVHIEVGHVKDTRSDPILIGVPRLACPTVLFCTAGRASSGTQPDT